jgi:hypothetical protein
MTMIEEILQDFTPYNIKGRTLYDEQDVKKMIAKAIQLTISPKHSTCAQVEQYPEATC